MENVLNREQVLLELQEDSRVGSSMIHGLCRPTALNCLCCQAFPPLYFYIITIFSSRTGSTK